MLIFLCYRYNELSAVIEQNENSKILTIPKNRHKERNEQTFVRNDPLNCS